MTYLATSLKLAKFRVTERTADEVFIIHTDVVMKRYGIVRAPIPHMPSTDNGVEIPAVADLLLRDSPNGIPFCHTIT